MTKTGDKYRMNIFSNPVPGGIAMEPTLLELLCNLLTLMITRCLKYLKIPDYHQDSKIVIHIQSITISQNHYNVKRKRLRKKK